MNPISFMSANFVARQVGYRMTEGWAQGQQATEAYFKPVETYAARLEALLQEVQAMGFENIDIWIGHLHPAWATDTHIHTVRSLLEQFGFKLASLAGWFGGARAEFEAACRLAAALGASILGGNTSLLASDRAYVVATLRRYGLRLGHENHTEKSAEEIMAVLGVDDDVIGATFDTGHAGAHGYAAAATIETLGARLIHIHLKDVRTAGSHETCALGEGDVGIEACVRALKKIGYAGFITVEHEPALEDPTPACAASRERLRAWLL